MQDLRFGLGRKIILVRKADPESQIQAACCHNVWYKLYHLWKT